MLFPFLTPAYAQKSYDKIVCIPSEGSNMQVKITTPKLLVDRDKLIVWSFSSLDTEFIYKDLIFYSALRNHLINSGYVNIEFIGRRDSAIIAGHKFSTSTINTNVVDLQNLLKYVRTEKDLKEKKIILVGVSEGGEVNATVASNESSSVFGMLQLSCSAMEPKQFMLYQREYNYTNFYYKFTFGVPATIDRYINQISSLDGQYQTNLSGVKKFFMDHNIPIDSIMFKYDDVDTIISHTDSYLRSRWAMESEEAKSKLDNNFENYYTYMGHLTPQQIVTRKWDAEKYYPSIKCPLLAVQGTNDERINCKPNIERMGALLKKGGNQNFKSIVIDGCDHYLTKKDRKTGENICNEDVLRQIIEWINKL